MKKYIFIIAILLFAFSSSVFAESIYDKDAKNMVLNGEVLGVSLIDEKYAELFDVDVGIFFAVKFNNNIYGCVTSVDNFWKCQTL